MTDEPTNSSGSRSRSPARNGRGSGRAPRPWSWLAGWLALALWVGASMSSVADEAKALSAEQLKAAFILNFPKYVEWPTNAFATTNTPIVLGMVGDEKLCAEIEGMGADKKVNGRPLVIRRVTADAELEGCQILFIAAPQARRTPELLAKLKGRGVLTVGENENFLESGGMINLVRKDRKIGLEINLAPATAADIKISSKLLGVATVKGRPN